MINTPPVSGEPGQAPEWGFPHQVEECRCRRSRIPTQRAHSRAATRSELRLGARPADADPQRYVGDWRTARLTHLPRDRAADIQAR
jgi:hypothetical protein